MKKPKNIKPVRTLSEYWRENAQYDAKDCIVVAPAYPVVTGDPVSTLRDKNDICSTRNFRAPEDGYQIVKMTPGGFEADIYMTAAELAEKTTSAEDAPLVLPRTNLPGKMLVTKNYGSYDVREKDSNGGRVYTSYGFHCLFNDRAEDRRPENRSYRVITFNDDPSVRVSVFSRDTPLKDDDGTKYTVEKGLVAFQNPADPSRIELGANHFARFGLRLKT